MTIGQLVKINDQCGIGRLRNKIGIVTGRKRRCDDDKTPLVRVLLIDRELFFNTYTLDIVQ